ncbi:Uma2 family endonuclease [Actinomadura macrotermitis]|uniref:Putative restriction endonuclease domain-containing protein n=1 Tax=Actinomadura macrotermitis TaxID=2585200 RepID=A0A7K0BQE2_9ACTN|nr:Uma2 family endonuclease [Actinomadura macrotermitis]MQY03400.1 hypothetical protein [Actinomadura macrotermitis]
MKTKVEPESMLVRYQDPTALPDLYELWVDDELGDHFFIPEGSRVEVIGDEVVVSPAPTPQHNGMVRDIVREIDRAAMLRPDFPWDADIGSGVSLVGARKGPVPDLSILDKQMALAVRRDRVKKLVADQVELVVEITSPRNATTDRRPAARSLKNKWNLYSASGIPYYLLIDRDPKVARTFLYSIPDEESAAYLHEESWKFSETVHLPEPIDLEIPTVHWNTWDEC